MNEVTDNVKTNLKLTELSLEKNISFVEIKQFFQGIVQVRKIQK